MKIIVFFVFMAFASDENKNITENPSQRNENDPILVKIEEDECSKVKSKYFGVLYHKSSSTWGVRRWSKIEKKYVSNGYYKNEIRAACASDALARKLNANGEHLQLNFPDDSTEWDTEIIKKYPNSKYIGVSYDRCTRKWRANRWSDEKRRLYNGYYKYEETAAQASDTLARKLKANGEENHKLNFPDDSTEVLVEEKITSSEYVGVTLKYKTNQSKWMAQRHSRKENKPIYGGCYKDEETAARASDTLAKDLMANGEQDHKLNFPNDNIEVYSEKSKSSRYFGVVHKKEKATKWQAFRWSKLGNKTVYNGTYKDEIIAARASDALARKLMANGEENQRLNFPNGNIEVCQEKARKQKRKRPDAP